MIVLSVIPSIYQASSKRTKKTAETEVLQAFKLHSSTNANSLMKLPIVRKRENQARTKETYRKRKFKKKITRKKFSERKEVSSSEDCGY